MRASPRTTIALLLLAGLVVSCGQQAPPPSPANAPSPAASPGVATQDPCSSAESQAEMTRCWSEAAVAAEQRSGEAYAQLATWLQQRQQSDVAQRFSEAQARWETYRDAHCESVTAVYEGGSMAGLQAAHCRARLAEQRRRELEAVMSDADN